MWHPNSLKGLLGLPGELLLEVLSELTVLRDFGHENYITVPKGYQDENQQRIAALGYLCLTSKKLHLIVTRVLYSAIVVYPGISMHRLTSFLLTIIEKPHLGEHATFVEYMGFDLNAVYSQNPDCHDSLILQTRDSLF
jgi:hypothetical protein